MSTAEANYNNKLEGYKGNSKDIFCAVKDASGNCYDLSGYNSYFYMQKYPIRPNNPIDLSTGQTSIDVSNGAVYFGLSSSQLDISIGDYLYEIIIDNGAGIVISVVQDNFKIKTSLF